MGVPEEREAAIQIRQRRDATGPENSRSVSKGQFHLDKGSVKQPKKCDPALKQLVDPHHQRRTEPC